MNTDNATTQPTFVVGQVVKGQHFNHKFLQAEVLEIDGDYMTVDVFRGSAGFIGRQRVLTNWCEPAPYRLVTEPNGDVTVERTTP
jgi:hypothetical protein